MAVTQVNLTYTSTIDGLSLSALAAYPAGASGLPVLIVMHTFGTTVATAFDTAARERYADGFYYHLGATTGAFVNGEAIGGNLGGAALNNTAGPGLLVPMAITVPFQVGEVVTGAGGASAAITGIDHPQFFALFVEMRGRGASGGAKDAGGREIQDILDALDTILTTYPSETDADQVHIVGWSGGGGNALSSAARFPDRFNSVISFYGISDYGYDPADGWYQNAPGYQPALEAQIGGAPAAVVDRYHARASVLAISNFTGGHLFLFHDSGDVTVQVINSRNVAAAMDSAGRPNTTYAESAPGDDPRWVHALPLAGAAVILGEPACLGPAAAKSWPAWTVPAAGVLGVPGWLDTKRFSLWLGDGLGEYGRVVYNVDLRRFEIFGHTGPSSWTLKVKGQTPGASVTAKINGLSYTAAADGAGVVTYTDTEIHNRLNPVAVKVGASGL